MQEIAEIYEEIEQINLKDGEGVKEEITTILNKVQDEAFMKGFEYAIQILKETMIVSTDAKNPTT